MLVKPDINIKSIYDIDLDELQKSGIKALLFDLDSTLMASKSGKYSEKMLDWLKSVREKFFIAVVSNNNNKDYIDKVKKVTDFPVVFNAQKPCTDVTESFMRENGLMAGECAFVGDRPLTDILCGQKLGCKTILVDSITADSESKIVRFARFLERCFVKK